MIKFSIDGQEFIATLPAGYTRVGTRITFKGERPFIRAVNSEGRERLFAAKDVRFIKDA